MYELYLSRAEMLYLVIALDIESAFGLDLHDIVPENVSTHERLRAEGEASLMRRGLLWVSDDGVRVFDVTLFAICAAITHAERGIVAVRNVTGVGPQLFQIAQSDSFRVEHTRPDVDTHRFALLPSEEALTARLLEVLPIAETPPRQQAYSIAQDTFFAVEHFVEAGNRHHARSLLDEAGIPAHDAVALLDAFARPALRGNVAFVRCEGDQIVEGRNVAILASDDSAWMFRQRTPGEPVVLIMHASAADAQALYGQFMAELS